MFTACSFFCKRFVRDAHGSSEVFDKVVVWNELLVFLMDRNDGVNFEGEFERDEGYLFQDSGVNPETCCIKVHGTR